MFKYYQYMNSYAMWKEFKREGCVAEQSLYQLSLSLFPFSLLQLGKEKDGWWFHDCYMCMGKGQ